MGSHGPQTWVNPQSGPHQNPMIGFSSGANQSAPVSQETNSSQGMSLLSQALQATLSHPPGNHESMMPPTSWHNSTPGNTSLGHTLSPAMQQPMQQPEGFAGYPPGGSTDFSTQHLPMGSLSSSFSAQSQLHYAGPHSRQLSSHTIPSNAPSAAASRPQTPGSQVGFEVGSNPNNAVAFSPSSIQNGAFSGSFTGTTHFVNGAKHQGRVVPDLPSSYVSPHGDLPGSAGVNNSTTELGFAGVGPSASSQHMSKYSSQTPSFPVSREPSVPHEKHPSQSTTRHQNDHQDEPSAEFVQRPRRGSPDLDALKAEADAADLTPEQQSKDDPLATKVWKMYAQQRASMANAHRMENLTWRMMSMTLRKQKEQELLENELQRKDSAPQSEERPTSLKSHPTSPRSSISIKESTSHVPDAQTHLLNDKLHGFTSMDEHHGQAIAASTKGRARFAEVEEEERGRRGRSSRTPERVSTGTGSGTEDSDALMDWRAKSKSRSRSRSVGAMEWRGASRSRSRAPAHHLQTIVDESNDILSQSLPISGGLTLNDLGGFDNIPDLLALGSLPAPNLATTHDTDVHTIQNNIWSNDKASQESMSRLSRKSYMQEAFKNAANSDLFGALSNAQQAPATAVYERNVPFFHGGGRKSSFDHPIGPANLMGAPLSNLGSVAGIADFVSHQANQHPEYGFLPKLVRKTSFDHKVKERSVSRSRAQEREATSVNTRKRAYEPSPARPMMMTSDERIASGLSRNLPPFASQSGSNFLHAVPATSFDFSVPPSNRPGGFFVPSSNTSGVTSPVTSPSALVGSGSYPSTAPSEIHDNGNHVNNHDLDAIMRMFYGSEIGPGQEHHPSVTHINPNQVFNNLNSIDATPPIPHTMFNGEENMSSPAWSYSPTSTSNPSPGQTPPPHTNLPTASPYHSSPLAINFTHSDASKGNKSSSARNAKKTSSVRKESNGIGKSDHASMATADPPTVCSNCNTSKTPLWRRDPEGQPLCNACGLFLKLHGVVRPLSLKTDVIKKRNRASGNGSELSVVKEGAKGGSAAANNSSSNHSRDSNGPSSSGNPAVRKVSQGSAPQRSTNNAHPSIAPGVLPIAPAPLDMKRQRRKGE